MKSFLIYCFHLILATTTHAQNLVVNGGFEDENICTEYHQNCAPEAWMATSLMANYYFDSLQQGAAKGHSGTHFVGLTAGSSRMSGVRNFIRSRLLCGLRPGNQYKLEMYVRSYHYILDSIGIYFSANDFLYEKREFKGITPQLWSTNGMDLKVKPSEWQKVEWIYTADGTEGFITIGNFKRVDYTGISGTEFRHDYYFFIDDILLTPVDRTERLCVGVDSLRTSIYAESERHKMLERKVYEYRHRTPPPLQPLPKTTFRQIRQRIDTLVIPDIFFATASYELSPLSYSLLDSFARQLSLPTIDSMVVEGHTDSIGKLSYNEALSLNRAVSVKNYLATKVTGLADKTITRGFAYRRPVAGNKTPKGRQQNRRVELFLYRTED